MADSSGKTVMVQGRILWTSGDLFKGKNETIFGTQTPKMNRKGEQAVQYGFGLAVPKDQFAPGLPGEALWNAIYGEAYTLYPNRNLPPAFALKYKDGDVDIDQDGTPLSVREGYAGHMVFAMTTSIPIQFFRNEQGQNIMINEGIKCGDYVQVQVAVKAHGPVGQGKPGMYLNPMAVLFLGYGKEIISKPTGNQIFGTAAPALPPGASAAPLAPPGGQMLVQSPPMTAPPGYVQQQWQAPVTQAPAPQQQAPQPHYAVLPQAHQPQQQPTNNGMPAFPGVPQR